MPGQRGQRASHQQHGGYRRPGSPAPVSGVGAAARRTDGGAGGQPVRAIPSGGPGATQGDRQASVQLQQGAPLAAAAPTPAPPNGAGPASAPAAPYQPVDPFGASRRPGEPITAGAALGPGAGAPNPDESTVAFLLELYRQHENDAIRDVLEEIQNGMGR